MADDTEVWVERFNQETKEGLRHCYPVRDRQLQSAARERLHRFVDELNVERHRNSNCGTPHVANAFLALMCVARSILSCLDMWIALRDDRPEDAWGFLVEAQELARSAMRAHNCCSHIGDHLEMLDAYEQILFPPQQFVSSSVVVGSTDCSICNGPYADCDHLTGLAYDGFFCSEIVRNISHVDHVAIVEYPDNKRCRATTFSEDGYDVNVMTLRRTPRQGDADEKGRNVMQMILLTGD
jgi:hypothetical protein